MNSKTARIALGVAVVAAAIFLLVVFKDGGGTEPSDAGKLEKIVVRNGEPVGGVRDLSYSKGDRIRFTVVSDVSDEIHVHGYDLMKDVRAGGSVTFDFPATLEGVFEAELEHRKEQIVQLTVNP